MGMRYTHGERYNHGDRGHIQAVMSSAHTPVSPYNCTAPPYFVPQVFGSLYRSEDGLLRFMRGMHCFAALSARCVQ